MELLILIDAAKRASPNEITAVIPYFGYARQDRKAESREPITSKLVANLLTTAGTNRILTIDLHADQIQGFFDIPLDHLTASNLFADYFSKKDLKNFVIVSPDAGSIRKANKLSKALDLPIVVIDKRRGKHNECDAVNVIGEIKDKNAILIDDMIDTGGTITNASKAIKEKGAKEVYICATHSVFSEGIIEKLNNSNAKEIIVTDTIPILNKDKIKNLKILSMAPIIKDAIDAIQNKKSMGKLFDRE